LQVERIDLNNSVFKLLQLRGTFCYLPVVLYLLHTV
jgi:hypothetical protein